jgi:hypothetical protein
MKEIKIDIKPLIRKLKIISKKQKTGILSGEYVTKLKSRGLEFLDYRHYTAGDDAKFIDWKASLRSQDILVKEFIDERNLNLFFLFDVSNSMLFASIEKLKCEYAAELIASMSYITLRAGNAVGLCLFNNKIVKILDLVSSNYQYRSILKILTNPSFYGGGFDIIFALKYLTSFLKQNALLIIISDFIGLKGGWEKYFNLIASKVETLVIMIRDPVDNYIPKNIKNVIISDPYSQKQILINTESFRKKYNKEVINYDSKIKRFFKKSEIDVIELTTNKPFTKEIIKFFYERK